MLLNCARVEVAKRSAWKWLVFTTSRQLNMNRIIAQPFEQIVHIGKLLKTTSAVFVLKIILKLI